jgi:hypothetical protein
MLGMRWDEAVDVAYVGSGADSGPSTTGMDGRLGVNVPGLAAAIVAVDAGEMAFVPLLGCCFLSTPFSGV